MLMTELLSSYAKDFCFMEKKRKPDGAGGYIPTWIEGEHFKAITKHDQTIEAQIAEKQEGISTYTFIVDKKVVLEEKDIIKRIDNGKTYMVTVDSTDKQTPEMSSLDMAVITAKEWELTT